MFPLDNTYLHVYVCIYALLCLENLLRLHYMCLMYTMLKKVSRSLTLAAWLSFKDVKHDDHHYGDGHDEDS